MTPETSLPKRSEAVSRDSQREPLASVLKTTVTVKDGGAEQSKSTQALTLKDALVEMGLYLEPEDRLSLPLDTPLNPGESLEVTVLRAEWKSVETVEEVPFSSVTSEDPSSPQGSKVVKQAGVPGSKKVVSLVAFLPDGTQTSSKVVGSSVTPPVDELISVGTKKVPPKPSTPAFTPPSPDSARAMGLNAVLASGWDEAEFACLDALWTRESNWNAASSNRSSGAYGIPQALPGSKMASAGADWATNPQTQISWGLGYIKGRYGTPCKAWDHSRSSGWY